MAELRCHGLKSRLSIGSRTASAPDQRLAGLRSDRGGIFVEAAISCRRRARDQGNQSISLLRVRQFALLTHCVFLHVVEREIGMPKIADCQRIRLDGGWRHLVLLAGLGIAGCVDHYTLPPSTPAANQAEAGTVLVSPTMVAPWDDVSAALRPNFALTGDQAATQVLPTTENISEQVLSAFGASLAAGLPPASSTSTSTTGGTSSGTTSTTDNSSGKAPTIANTLPAGVALPTGPTASATLGLDPVLKYKAANFLLQQVQLLNEEIDNAASRSCYVPYVVKTKLAVMNYRPRLPYSVHTHIGFLYNGALAS